MVQHQLLLLQLPMLTGLVESVAAIISNLTLSLGRSRSAFSCRTGQGGGGVGGFGNQRHATNET